MEAMFYDLINTMLSVLVFVTVASTPITMCIFNKRVLAIVIHLLLMLVIITAIFYISFIRYH